MVWDAQSSLVGTLVANGSPRALAHPRVKAPKEGNLAQMRTFAASLVNPRPCGDPPSSHPSGVCLVAVRVRFVGWFLRKAKRTAVPYLGTWHTQFGFGPR